MESWILAVAFIGIVYVVFSLFVTNTFGNRKRVREIQKEMFDYNKQLTAAIKTKDDKKIEELQEKNKQLMPLMMESMKHQFIPMLIILPAIVLAVHGITVLYPENTAVLPFGVPILHPDTTWDAISLFWLVVVPLGLISGILYSKYEMKKVEEKKVEQKKD